MKRQSASIPVFNREISGPKKEPHFKCRPARVTRRTRQLLILLAAVILGVIAGAWSGWVHWQKWENRYWAQAQDALERYDLEAAAISLERHLQRRPDDVAAWFLAARTARRLERFADAERFLERCQQLGGVSDATRLEWDLLRVQRGELRDIHTRLRTTIGPEHPDAAIVLEALASGYLKTERLSEARDACYMWLKREPDNPRPWLWRGQISERLAYFEQAADDYGRAVEKLPDLRDSRLALGWLLLRQRRAEEAAVHFEHVLKNTSDDQEAMLGLAWCRLEQGLADEAVPLIDRVLAQTPDSPRGLFLRGKACWQQGDPANAVGYLRKCIQTVPDDTHAYYVLIQCLSQLQRKSEAEELSEQLESLRKDLHRLIELTRAVAADPEDVKHRHEAGALALRVGRTQEALRWFNSALQVKGDHRPTHAALAEYYRRNGNPTLAENHRQMANNP